MSFKATEYQLHKAIFPQHIRYTVGDNLLVFRINKNIHVACGFYNKKGKPFLTGKYHNLDWLSRDKEWMDAEREKWFAVIKFK